MEGGKRFFHPAMRRRPAFPNCRDAPRSAPRFSTCIVASWPSRFMG